MGIFDMGFARIFLGVLCAFGLAAPLAAQSAQLDLLDEMMEAICGDYQYTGTKQELSIDGAAEAKIGGIMGKMVDVGVKGAAGFNEQEYVGVLRKELGAQLTDVRACRMQVYKDMKEVVFSAPKEKIEVVEAAVKLDQPVAFLGIPEETGPVTAFRQKPSFDCAKASTPTEYTLCGDDYLASLDLSIDTLYFDLRDRLSGQSRQNLLESQRTFLKKRNRCEASVPCLVGIHEQRIVELGSR